MSLIDGAAWENDHGWKGPELKIRFLAVKRDNRVEIPWEEVQTHKGPVCMQITGCMEPDMYAALIEMAGDVGATVFFGDIPVEVYVP